jgi:hypothetical protein
MSESTYTSLSKYLSYGHFKELEEAEREASGLVSPVVETKAKIDPNADKNWFRRHLIPLSMGVLLTSSVVSFAVSPGTSNATLDKIKHQLQWLLDSLVASTSLWLGGAALIGKGAGKGIEHPFQLKDSLSQLKSNIYENRHVRAGLWLNIVGALGNAGLASTVVLTSLPRSESLGVLGAVGFDLAGALVIRAGVMSAIREHGQMIADQPDTGQEF